MKKSGLALLILGFVGGCSAQVQGPSAQNVGDHIDERHGVSTEHVQTVKPGADVQIRTALREPVSPGGAGALNITFTEQYAQGNMNVSVSTSEGLELFTTIRDAVFDMSSGSEHDWTVYFSAPQAGKHYINFHVRVDTPFGPQTKSSAAIVNIGKPDEVVSASKADERMETDAEGQRIIMMDAIETITQGE